MQHSHELRLWNKVELLSAETTVYSNLITHLSIGAKCYRAFELDELIQRISRYKNIESVRLSDDFIPDSDMEFIKNTISTALNISDFQWSRELLIEGKHGR